MAVARLVRDLSIAIAERQEIRNECDRLEAICRQLETRSIRDRVLSVTVATTLFEIDYTISVVETRMSLLESIESYRKILSGIDIEVSNIRSQLYVAIRDAATQTRACDLIRRDLTHNRRLVDRRRNEELSRLTWGRRSDGIRR